VVDMPVNVATASNASPYSAISIVQGMAHGPYCMMSYYHITKRNIMVINMCVISRILTEYMLVI
jgi:hypothetical protein